MRLIDADALPKLLDAECKQTMKLIWEGEKHLDTLAEGFAEASHIAKYIAPTVDAAPVVRCMDCESARELTQHESIYLADGVLICTNCEVSEGCRLPVWPQHFCGYGRKKDGSEEDVVETAPIVRCENCMYWVSGKNECESWEWCKMLNTDMPPNGFCYLGDRKDDDDDKTD